MGEKKYGEAHARYLEYRPCSPKRNLGLFLTVISENQPSGEELPVYTEGGEAFGRPEATNHGDAGANG